MVQKLTQEKANITLGYWGIRGLAQPIRYLLIAASVPFSEVRLGVLQDGTLLDEDKEDVGKLVYTVENMPEGWW